MKNKILKTIPLLLFIIIFSIFFSGEFIIFHKEKNELKKENINLENQLQKFSFEKIIFLDETEIFYTPDENILDKIIKKIEQAEQKVYIEVYMLTETRIQNAIIKAKKRGIDTKVILEKSPYMATNINNKSYNFLIKNKIDIVWSNPNNYSLNHSKIILIDNMAIISTWNFTYSSFKYNRDFFVFTQDKKIVSNLNSIFSNDYNFNKNIIYNDNLIISPNYSRQKIEYLINNSEKNIDMYFPYMQDDNLEKLLINKVKSWVSINIIVDKNIEENQTYKNFEQAWIKIKKLSKKKLHAKAILIDNKHLYIWSINFSSYSLDKNREIWILIKNENIIKKFSELFKKDNL